VPSARLGSLGNRWVAHFSPRKWPYFKPRSTAGGQTAAVLYTLVGTCKHLSIDPLFYLRKALPGLFALGEKPTAEQLLDWLPDRWLLRRARESPEKARAG
jgi:hypothetical protein